MLKNEYLVYINANGESLHFGYTYELIPTILTDELDNDIRTSKFALQNGSTVNSTALGDREISLTCIYAISKATEIESKLKKVLNPTIDGTFYKYTGNEYKKITVHLTSIPYITRSQGMGQVEIVMRATQPFYEVTKKTEILAKEQALLMFPINFIEQNVFGYRVTQVETLIQNSGDIETGFICVFKANGNVTNPSIINNLTGEQIKLQCELVKGDTIKIINLPYNKMVLKNDTKDFSLLNLSETTFFNLLVGRNKLGINADANLINLESRIEFTPLYL